MSKLYFRHGTVGSAKTMNLLAVAHTYELQKKRVIIMKSAIDTRFGKATIKSRCGLSREADIIISCADDILNQDYTGCSCVLVDEIQFCKTDEIDALRSITKFLPVIGYGLRTDFQAVLFEGSKRMFEVADQFEEIKTTCVKCNKKGIFNLRHQNGEKVMDGPQVKLGTEDTYSPVCYYHFVNF